MGKIFLTQRPDERMRADYAADAYLGCGTVSALGAGDTEGGYLEDGASTGGER
jgi:hypothetical protein